MEGNEGPGGAGADFEGKDTSYVGFAGADYGIDW